MKNRVLSAEGITFSYGTSARFSLYDISVKITPNEITALLGPNGSGKTTLIDILIGWKVPDSGTVRIDDLPIHSLSRRNRSKLLSLVPQNEPLPFSFTIVDYVMFGRAPHLPQLAMPGLVDLRIAMDALETVGMAESCNQSITALSSGERQLVMLARAIAQQTEIILLDEPTSNLDPGNTGKVLDLLQKLKGLGHTILFSTHDPASAAFCSDHVIMINKGKKIMDDSVETALTDASLSTLYNTELKVTEINGSRIIYRP